MFGMLAHIGGNALGKITSITAIFIIGAEIDCLITKLLKPQGEERLQEQSSMIGSNGNRFMCHNNEYSSHFKPDAPLYLFVAIFQFKISKNILHISDNFKLNFMFLQ